MSTQLPWFRLYAEAIDDEKLRLLAFEDRWHFIALLCCKCQGILDQTDPLLRRKIAVKLGVDVQTLDEIARRLSEVGLIDKETLEPIKWDERQFKSDSSKERVAKYRARQKQKAAENSSNEPETVTETGEKRDSNVTVTAQDTDEDKDTDEYITPPTPPVGGDGSPEKENKSTRKPSITLKTFMAECKANGEPAISAYQPVLDYVESTGLPIDFVQLAWEVFKKEFSPGGANEHRKQKDWRRHFLNYVQKGYYRLWYAKPGDTPDKIEYHLSTQGHQAKAAIASKE